MNDRIYTVKDMRHKLYVLKAFPCSRGVNWDLWDPMENLKFDLIEKWRKVSKCVSEGKKKKK
jgi:hypothetical protein